jgi:DNA polymerase-1
MTILLIDGDLLLYQHAFAAETPTDWGDGLWTLHADLVQTSANFDQHIRQLELTLGAKRSVLALSDSVNWRKGLAPYYKAHRAESRKPMILKPLREHAEQAYETVCWPTLEADDVLGIIATKPQNANRCIIVSNDKDLLQIPGRHFRPMDAAAGIQIVTGFEGDMQFYRQTLSGDKADNYPGCPGVGPLMADRIIEGTTDFWGAIVAAYAKAGLTEEDALLQARLARILRDEDYDSREGVRLWQPPR